MFSYVDGHCDTITKLADQNGLLLENNGHIDLKRMKSYPSAMQIFAVWLKKEYLPIAKKKTIDYIQFYYQQLKENSMFIEPVFCFQDILDNQTNGKLSALLSLEGGEALEKETENLYDYYWLGVRLITLTWNRRNALGDGCKQLQASGLTSFGKQIVLQMQSLGMLVDVSHLSENGFWDVEKLAVKPFIASHSNARAICDNNRNLTDEQLRAVCYHGGVIGITFYPPFLSKEKNVSLEDIFHHIDHILLVAGEDSICLGGDFDGFEDTFQQMRGIQDYSNFFSQLEKRYGESIAKKITKENLLRVFRETLPLNTTNSIKLHNKNPFRPF